MLSTHQTNRQAGLTLIELMIGVVVLGILAAVAVPNFRTWMQNTQVRNAAESITNGLQRARAEAVARNTNVEFVLTAGSSWVVQLVGGANIETRSRNDGSKDVTIVAVAADLATPATTITFNNFGGIAANADGSASLAQVDFATADASRPLRTTIGVGGNAKMCDPHLISGPRAC